MANVLTDLAADIYTAADKVGRELSGGVTSVTINASGAERAAVGDTVRSHFTREATEVDVAPSMTIPEGTDQTVDNKTLSITKAKAIQIPWTGEDMKSVNNGSGFQTIYGDQIRQAMRKLTNLIEIDVMTAAYQGSSRAVGAAGTTPFASNFNLVAEARQILVDNGSSIDDSRMTMVMNTLAGTNLRNLAQLQKANESGGSELLRNGTLLDLQGLMLKESAGIRSHTKGTGAGYLVNNASAAVGDTVIPADTGSGTILAGDTVTFAGDTNVYVVETALTAGSFTIAAPGLRVAVADNAAITVGNSFTGNVAFHQSAIELAMRAPAVPDAGDAADDAILVQDPYSGLVFEIRAYKGYRKAMFEVAAAWGQKVWKPEHVALMLG